VAPTTEPTTQDTDTIVAVATAPGRGGVGVVRLSGPSAIAIARTLTGRAELPPRLANYAKFRDSSGNLLDSGLAIAFPGPASFTGEDVAELQGHGSPVMLDALVRAALAAGARLARPGEFSERAYLNGKMDLAQAEAVADLINAASEVAAQAAARSLQGEFSALMNGLSGTLVRLRVQVEAAIDFPDEDIELLAAPGITAMLAELIGQVDAIRVRTRSGVRLTEGARLVLFGAPNVGKSSLLNSLCGEERAIVTDIAGTTRDLVREQLVLNGIPVELVDTAGLRLTNDAIEAEGVRRAQQAALGADLILGEYDCAESASYRYLLEKLEQIKTERSVQYQDGTPVPVVIVANKVDLQKNSEMRGLESKQALTYNISAKTGQGIDELTAALVNLLLGDIDNSSNKDSTLPEQTHRDQTYSARSRHLLALDAAAQGLMAAQASIEEGVGAELVAEHLRHAQADLGSVCGEITTDALLGEIFSNFCIGK